MLEIPDDWRTVADSDEFKGAQHGLHAAFQTHRAKLLAHVPLPDRAYLHALQPRNFWPDLEGPPRDLRGRLLVCIAGYLRPPIEGGDMRAAQSFCMDLRRDWSRAACATLPPDQRRALVDVAFSHRQEYLDFIMHQGNDISAENLLNLQRHCEQLRIAYEKAITGLVRKH